MYMYCYRCAILSKYTCICNQQCTTVYSMTTCTCIAIDDQSDCNSTGTCNILTGYQSSVHYYLYMLNIHICVHVHVLQVEYKSSSRVGGFTDSWNSMFKIFRIFLLVLV